MASPAPVIDETPKKPHVEFQVPKPSTVKKRGNHAVPHALHYFVLFSSYWFGANRFDVDGDGDEDFDPTDAPADFKVHDHLHRTSRRTRKGNDARDSSSSGNSIVDKAANPQEAEAAQSANDASRLHNLVDCERDWTTDVADATIITVEATEAQADEIQPIPTPRQVFPYFTILYSVVTFGLWFAFALVKAANEASDWRYVQAGLDTISAGTFTLALSTGDCDDLRPQIWRWITYQFTHVDLSHVGVNTLMNIMLGVPLELLHRWWRVAIMFNAGILGGAFGYFVGDSHAVVVGCSGGGYALIGVHIVDLLLNWKQRKFRIPTIVVLASMIGTEIIINCTSEDSGKSSSAHLGGAIAGVCVGFVVVKNVDMEAHYRIISAGFLILGAFLTTMCISWMVAQADGPRNIFEAASGESGWCWYRQVWDNRVNPDAYECVRCGTKRCINQVSNFSKVLPVSWKECHDKGRWHDL